MRHTPDAAAADVNPLVHYLLRKNFADSHPHPLFSADLYISNSPDLVSSKLDPLTHYLTIGWKRGVWPNKVFDPQWYLEKNADVRARGGEPLSHYMQWGWREGRRPAASIDAGSLGGEMPATIGDARGRMEPTCAATAFHSVAEPEIRPPPPAAIVDERRHARDIEIVMAVRALRSHNGGYSSASSDSAVRDDEMKIISAKLELAAAGEYLTVESAGAAVRQITESSRDKGRAAVDGLLGLGITPDRAIDESCLSDYPHPILNRYNRARLEIGRRFALDPSRAGTVEDGPTISILIPVYKVPIIFLERAILSVLFQTYANWELILVDDCSRRSDVEALLKYYAGVDPRIKVHFRAQNGGISVATNEALTVAAGSYIGLFDHDDMLTRDALQKIAARLVTDPDLDFVYTDECKIDANNLVDDVFFKPDWSSLLLNNFMYTGHFSVYRKNLVEQVGGFRSKYDLSQDYDLVLRVTERQPKVAHVDECLYGWRMIAGSGAAGDKPQARLSNVAALQEAADRRGYDGIAIALPTANRVKRSPRVKPPLVSIVVPSDKSAHIRDTLNSIILRTSYRHYEIIVVTNSKIIGTFAGDLAFNTVRFVEYDKPYNFADKCNVGAARLRGEYVVFYNDDVRVISPDWIETLLEYLTLPGVGAVAPKLIYENGSIQHAGMVTGVRRLVGTAFHSYPADTTAYFNMAQSARETSLLCAACLAMPVTVFGAIGGFDALNTPVAHSDIDLCFRVRDSGRSCVYTPHAQLTHIGHVSIGAVQAEDTKRAKAFRKDKAELFVLKKWGHYLKRDPYFPPKMRDLLYVDSQEEFIFEKSWAQIRSTTGRDFILFSHDLSASGAPRCLYEAARVLIEEGHYVLVMSPGDGPFRRRFAELGADVIVDPLALSGHEAVTDLVKHFDVAICNTVVCWPVPQHLAPYMPVYLYCHETEHIRHLCDNEPGFHDSLAAATAIWGSGPLSAAMVRQYCDLDALSIEPCIEEMPDLPDEARDKSYPGEVVIALIGTYELRKGQDIAVEGFKRLPQEILKGFSAGVCGPD